MEKTHRPTVVEVTVLAVGELNELSSSLLRGWSLGCRRQAGVWISNQRGFSPFSPVDSLGISDELKDKLEDVLIPEQQFTLGRMLGKGMWDCRDWHEWSLLCLVVPINARMWI